MVLMCNRFTWRRLLAMPVCSHNSCQETEVGNGDAAMWCSGSLCYLWGRYVFCSDLRKFDLLANIIRRFYATIRSFGNHGESDGTIHASATILKGMAPSVRWIGTFYPAVQIRVVLRLRRYEFLELLVGRITPGEEDLDFPKFIRSGDDCANRVQISQMLRDPGQASGV
jgi:hypothetical protein